MVIDLQKGTIIFYMLKLLIRIILALSVPLLFVGAVSYYADPGEIFQDRSKQIAAILRHHKNVALHLIPANWSKIQIEMVKNFKNDNYLPNTVVWGNSRSAEIGQDFAASQTFFNHVLPGANILDYMALLALYKETNQLPPKILLTIDPTLFYATKANSEFFVLDNDTSHHLNPRKGLENYCQQGLKQIDTSGFFAKKLPIVCNQTTFLFKLKMLLMPDYFQTSLRSLGKEPVSALEEKGKSGFFVLRKDGGYSLADMNMINETQVAARTERFCKATNGIFFCDTCVQNIHYQLFEKMLIYLVQVEKREIVLFFPPVHPVAYTCFSQKEQMQLEIKTKRLADSLKIAYIGSFNPYLFGLDKIEKPFIDEIHLSPAGLRQVLGR